MIRELFRTLIGDLRARVPWRDIEADLWATYYAMKVQRQAGPR
ncbi:hypothetical protein GCM10022239_11770 [Leifsonia bigeumensis]|uniref:Uncharacterized protein n=1 Tax=Leifsonella bigeumensis TaxID=433643 RepID=A0ABP7FGR7_9MICO